MAQVTLYLDQATAELMKKAARAAGLSRSRWLTKLVQERTTQEWPASVHELAGAWPEFPLAEELRQGQPEDVGREEL